MGRCKALAGETLVWLGRHGYCGGAAGGGERSVMVLSMGLTEFLRQVCRVSPWRVFDHSGAV